MRQKECLHYALIKRDTGDFLGYIIVKPDSEENREDTRELGFAVRKDFRKNGYMSEAVRAVLKELEDEGITYVWACCFKGNEASEHLIRKLGFEFQKGGTFESPNDRVYESYEFRMTLGRNQTMNFEITDKIESKDRDAVHEGLHDYNISKIEDKNPKDLGIYHRVNGVIKAGLIGDTHGNWLEVEFLWVAEELRGTGIGSSLLKAAEEEAVKRGCKRSFLNTFGFQAPEFYPKYGYQEVFVLEDYPRTGTRHFYIKDL